MSKLEKIIKLVKKTGDKYIITDKSGDPQAVIMDFNEYELLTTSFGEFEASFSGFPEDIDIFENKPLTEGEMLDKINRELNDWQKSREEEKVKELERELKAPDSFEEDEDRYYLEPID